MTTPKEWIEVWLVLIYYLSNNLGDLALAVSDFLNLFDLNDQHVMLMTLRLNVNVNSKIIISYFE